MTRLRDVQMHAIVYSADANGGPGVPKLELDPDMLNLVWQQNLNAPGRAAFTMSRFNPKGSQILGMQDHLKLFREDSRGVRTVFAGKLVKPNYSGSDVIWYGWDYLAFLQRSRTGFRVEYPEKLIGTEIVSPEWALAKAVSNSPFAFVTTGTIENPLGVDGVTPIKTNEEFGVIDFTRLFVFFSLAEMAMANTANTVKFEITREAPHTFNFWKNYGSDITKYAFQFPGNLAAHDFDSGLDQYVNDIATVIGDGEGDDAEHVALSADVATSPYRRLQDAIALRTLLGTTGATESDQGKAALERMLQERLRTPKVVLLQPRQNEVGIFDGWDLGDNMRVTLQKADRSGDEYDGYAKIISIGAAWSPQHGELVQLYARQPEVANP